MERVRRIVNSVTALRPNSDSSPLSTQWIKHVSDYLALATENAVSKAKIKSYININRPNLKSEAEDCFLKRLVTRHGDLAGSKICYGKNQREDSLESDYFIKKGWFIPPRSNVTWKFGHEMQSGGNVQNNGQETIGSLPIIIGKTNSLTRHKLQLLKLSPLVTRYRAGRFPVKLKLKVRRFANSEDVMEKCDEAAHGGSEKTLLGITPTILEMLWKLRVRSRRVVLRRLNRPCCNWNK